MHLICNQEMVGSIPTIPVTENAKGVKLVSGASANILESVMTGELKSCNFLRVYDKNVRAIF